MKPFMQTPKTLNIYENAVPQWISFWRGRTCLKTNCTSQWTLAKSTHCQLPRTTRHRALAKRSADAVSTNEKAFLGKSRKVQRNTRNITSETS